MRHYWNLLARKSRLTLASALMIGALTAAQPAAGQNTPLISGGLSSLGPALSQLWWGSHPTVLQRAGLPASMRAAER